MTRRYPLSDAMQAFVVRTQSMAVASPTLAAQREGYLRMAEAFCPPRPAGLCISELLLEGLPEIRLYRPASLAPESGWPTVLYLHGGGWTLGNAGSHDVICAELAARLQALVVAVSYRLAPEHPYPAALHDCRIVWQRLRSGSLGEPVDIARLVVAGDSAGGNLSAALCLALRDTGEPLPGAQALIYPALGDQPTPSRTQCANAPLLTSEEVDNCLNAYLSRPADRRDPLALPLMAEDLRGLPPAFIAVAEFDPLRDDGALYRDRLRAAGVDVEYFAGPGLVHGCLRAHDVAEVVQLRVALLAFLRRHLR
ncbi:MULTISPECIES: alpha/beta hydrolase [Pseudomonas]|uniref:Alpha/beta hydrolase n=1 Tax=Pseudomonas nitroreducens TaxID=46680 RepID=A0ABS0KUT3_PSENT|nr:MULTISPECIES: alpha/beta hydrolase [Pseudomonas]MBG6291764.1 alpha/beta hydrolase [Pseudomonas nitroreducens]NNN23472.1 alpha/beta hydrolase [Pseudomonas nitroreducens]OBY61020.1 lipase [Pseudomonas sp. AU12215]